jgi:Protein of unknown function (DUF4230)
MAFKLLFSSVRQIGARLLGPAEKSTPGLDGVELRPTELHRGRRFRGVMGQCSICLAVVVGVAALAGGATLMASKYLRWGDAPPSLSTLENMGHLVGVKVNVADIVDHVEERLWIFGGVRVVLFVKGDCSLAVDLRSAKYEDIDSKNKTLTVVLPRPAILQARVIHGPQGTRVYKVSNIGLEIFIPGSRHEKAMEAAMAIAQEKVADAARAPDAVLAAKSNIERLLKGIFDVVGWHATFKWR